MLPSYPDESIQSAVGTWWTETPDREVRRGRLVYGWVPHVDENPHALFVKGRDNQDPGDHRRAQCEVGILHASRDTKRSSLPVAGLPQHDGEEYMLLRAKCRPMLVVGHVHPRMPRGDRGQTRWQTAPTLLVAPYYGCKKTPKRVGWPEGFVDRIRCCEYPQYFLEYVPEGIESVLRFDHVCPIGAGSAALTPSQYCLSGDALAVIDDWLSWIFRGVLPGQGILAMAREQFMREVVGAAAPLG